MKTIKGLKMGNLYVKILIPLVITMILSILWACPYDNSDEPDEDTNAVDGIEISWINEGTLLTFEAA